MRSAASTSPHALPHVLPVALPDMPPDMPPETFALDELLGDVAQYYSRKVLAHGATPLGVDWSCLPTQEMRFVQLLKLCEFDVPISINDIGCGYGALLAFLRKRYRNKTVDYLGVDISAAMIAHAKKRWKNCANVAFVQVVSGYRTADYSLASGVFNVKLSHTAAAWERMIEQTLRGMHAKSRLGFAANFLAPTPDGAPPVPELYRAPPAMWRNFCESAFDVNVEVIANYGMREYTLLARNKSSEPG